MFIDIYVTYVNLHSCHSKHKCLRKFFFHHFNYPRYLASVFTLTIWRDLFAMGNTLIQDKLYKTRTIYIASCEVYICVNFIAGNRLSRHDFMVNMLTCIFANLTYGI